MRRRRRTIGIVIAIVALAVPARAEPIQITSGALVWSLSATDTVMLAGLGFTFQGRAVDGRRPGEQCVLPVCGAGSSVDLTARYVGLDLPGTATLDGQTFTNVGGLTSSTSLDAMWAGVLAIPPDFAGGVLAAPFTFTGTFFINDPGGGILQDLFGQGTASLTFAPQGSDPTAFRVTDAIYEFDSGAPVPEPMSVLLVGTGLAGLAAVRRRRNLGGCNSAS